MQLLDRVAQLFLVVDHEVEPMPLLEPSAFGLTISGNFMSERQALARATP